jgi:LAS superfamily LD-carboxypeptidase LdcB
MNNMIVNNIIKKVLQIIVVTIIILCAVNAYIFILQFIKRENIKKGWHVEIITNFINIREEADQKSEKIGKVRENNIYKVLDIYLENNEYYFYKIEISDTKVGWIANDKKTESYLKDINNPNDIATPTIRVSNKTYNVESIADIDYNHLDVWDDKEDYVINHEIYYEFLSTQKKYWIIYTITDAAGKTNSTIQEITFLNEPDDGKTKKIEELSIVYFKPDRLKRYLDYIDENYDLMLGEVMSIVNTNADYEPYTNINDTNLSKANLLIVNKYNKLKSDYIPSDLIDIDPKYGTGKLQKEAYNHFIMMAEAAKKENLSLYVSSSYRNYDYQLSLYNNYISLYGQEYTDSVVARAGHSEHQTGLAIDISSNSSDNPYFIDTKEFKWLKNNAHKYGYILRYPEGKEKLTGYSYESWHYRYVGIDVATVIYNESTTYDEYYAYFIEL